MNLNFTANPPLEITYPECSPSVVGNNFTFTFKANKPAEYTCRLNSGQSYPCSKIVLHNYIVIAT